MSTIGEALRQAMEDDDPRIHSYRRLADVFHHVLSEQSLDALLGRIASALEDLIPYDTLTIYEVDEKERALVPIFARDEYAEEILRSKSYFGRGLTGWAVEHREPLLVNQAHLDPRTVQVPGTPDVPESMIVVPLIPRGVVKGTLNVYREGEEARFSAAEFELVQRFADAAALALDNAQIRASLELQAQTDHLTGVYNHRYFHERLRSELALASRSHHSVGLVMLDIDDFKKVNDVYGHAVGDEVLAQLANILTDAVRVSDVVCRVGGEEFGIIMPACHAGDALGLADRIAEILERTIFGIAGLMTVSIGVAQGPEHAMNPRELVACAEAAMMTAKARGKNRIVLFDEDESERPEPTRSRRSEDVRSIAHLKMLQSIAGKLNRLSDTRQIGDTIAKELRTLIDYHNCRVYVERDGMLMPISFRGELTAHEGEHPNLPPQAVGEGIAGHAAATGRSLLIDNALECEFAVLVPGTEEIEESQVVVPLTYDSRVVGVLSISKLGVGQFDEDDVRLLEVLAGQASVALENARLYEAQRREAANAQENADIANALLELSMELSAAEGLDEVLSRVVHSCARMLGSPRTSVWLQEPHSRDLVCECAWGYEETEREAMLDLRLGVDALAGPFESLKPFVISAAEASGIAGLPPAREEVMFAVAPILLDGGRFGAIAAAAPVAGKYEFSERKMRLLAGIASQARLAVNNAGNFENLEATFLSTVEALANALEAKDEYTSSHARSITDTSLEVGYRLGLRGRDLKRLELGALFHDIGKIGIPSHILLKPGPLDQRELQVMRKHPALGEMILAPIERLADVRPIVRHCHEHFDGSGYPDGKAGEDIPIEARVILVCDAFHAMTTDRPYRKRLPVEEACRRLREASGTQFDPVIVDIFLAMLQEDPPADAIA